MSKRGESEVPKRLGKNEIVIRWLRRREAGESAAGGIASLPVKLPRIYDCAAQCMAMSRHELGGRVHNLRTMEYTSENNLWVTIFAKNAHYTMKSTIPKCTLYEVSHPDHYEHKSALYSTELSMLSATCDVSWPTIRESRQQEIHVGLFVEVRLQITSEQRFYRAVMEHSATIDMYEIKTRRTENIVRLLLWGGR